MVRHPEEYFNNLPEWDKVGRIWEYAELLNPGGEVAALYFEMWIAGVVAQATGVATNPYLLILCGKQGIGKSTWIQWLVPNHNMHAIENVVFNKFDREMKCSMADNAIINLEEFDSMSQGQYGDLLRALTAPSMEVRRRYTANTIILDRHASFIASCNELPEYARLIDSRRFLAINVDSIDIDRLKSFDIPQMYAEAQTYIPLTFFTADDSKDSSAGHTV